ncbi:MAG TPA: GNAT family N-acetyltransferase [Burkholderiaceae bacterium]|nr:GNAT family N-acetyltransferase [Burkholderiaceae bacterium]
MKTRTALPEDLSSVLALNEESVRFLSPLSRARLEALTEQAAAHWVIEAEGSVAAFLLAFREGASYESINYRWFADRYPSFLYIDRVVVSNSAQGQGLGTALYRAAFMHAQATLIPVVTCEFDVDPPNPVSASFHAKFGFREVGRQLVAGGKKTVSLHAASVDGRHEA